MKSTLEALSASRERRKRQSEALKAALHKTHYPAPSYERSGEMLFIEGGEGISTDAFTDWA